MADPMQAQGFEVVDEKGRVRARLGLLHEDAYGPIFGLALYSDAGRQRAWLALAPFGPHLGLDQAGNDAVVLAVSDAIDPHDYTGPVFALTKDDGPPLQLYPGVLESLVEVSDDDGAGSGEEDER